MTTQNYVRTEWPIVTYSFEKSGSLLICKAATSEPSSVLLVFHPAYLKTAFHTSVSLDSCLAYSPCRLLLTAPCAVKILFSRLLITAYPYIILLPRIQFRKCVGGLRHVLLFYVLLKFFVSAYLHLIPSCLLVFCPCYRQLFPF